MTVNEHLKFVSENNSKIEKILESCRLSGHEKSKPEELSGGEKQRLALARAIAQKSDIFLLDEPLSSLDFSLKEDMKKLLQKLHRRYNLTVVYVAHDIFEIADMCDRIALLKNGRITKIGLPLELFKKQMSVTMAKIKNFK